MPASIERPLCVACRQMFSDEDVANENFELCGMSMGNGPSFIHKTCRYERSGIR